MKKLHRTKAVISSSSLHTDLNKIRKAIMSTSAISFRFIDLPKVKKGKMCIALHRTSSQNYGITQCYLPPVTSERTPIRPQPDWPVLDLPILEG